MDTAPREAAFALKLSLAVCLSGSRSKVSFFPVSSVPGIGPSMSNEVPGAEIV